MGFSQAEAPDLTISIRTPSFDTSGKFVVRGMYPDKSTHLRFENKYIQPTAMDPYTMR